jgi:outer membrane murein-binding lipoprotein Lpp
MSQKSRSTLTHRRCWLIVVCILWLGAGCSDIAELNRTMNEMAEADARMQELKAKMEADRPKWEAWKKDMDRMNKEFWERDAEIQRRFREMGITNTPNVGADRT